MNQLDFVLGPMLIGALLSAFLTGIMLVQCYNYFVRFPRDPGWMKFMVYYLLITDLVHTGLESAITYQYTVTLFGDLKTVFIATSTFAVIPTLSVSISSPAQCFFAWRVVRLTGVKFLGYLIASLALVQFRKFPVLVASKTINSTSDLLSTVCGIGVTIAITRVPGFLEFNKFEGVVIPWLAASILCDIVITGSLVYYLSSYRSGFKNTDDIITRLIQATIQTGFMTALWALLDLIVYRLEDNSLHLIFNFPLAKIYTNSLMSTLNARRAYAEALRGTYERGNNSGLGAAGNGESGGFTDAWEFEIPSRSRVSSTVERTIGPGEVGLSSFFPSSNASLPSFYHIDIFQLFSKGKHQAQTPRCKSVQILLISLYVL
jgi:hypothetical protein